MKTLSFLGACALLALGLRSVDAASGKSQVGYCESDKSCPANYACVSVQTTRSNVEDVKQCLPNSGAEPVCGGTQPGVCPSFSTTWGAGFREIASVCAYIVPNTKAKCIERGATNSSKNVIECYFVQDPDDPKNETAKIGVIYGCVDFDGTRLLFKKDDKSDKLQYQANYSSIVEDKCVNPKNPSGSSFVCSSQGTCSPSSQGKMDDYACKCNVGFSGKYCQKILDNKCYNDGVCGGGSCDPATFECTKCKAGTKGNKCAQCVLGAVNVCSGHGQCVASTGDSTLGVDDDTTTTNTTKTTTTESSGSTDEEVTVGDGSKSATVAKVVAPNYRRLSTVYQCKCDEGYSDVHCGVKLPAKKSNATTAPTTSSTAGSPIALSVTALVATLAAAFAL